MSNRTWFFTQRKDDWSTGIGMVPPPMSKDDPNCLADCECHDMPDESSPVEMTSEALRWFKENGLKTPEELKEHRKAMDIKQLAASENYLKNNEEKG